MTFENVRTQEIDGAIYYSLEDIARWLKIRKDKAQTFIHRYYPKERRYVVLKNTRYTYIRCTYLSSRGVVLVAAEYSVVPNHTVRTLTGGNVGAARQTGGA